MRRAPAPALTRLGRIKEAAAGGIVGRRRQGTSIIYWIAEPTVSKLCDLVCGRLAAEALTREARTG